MDVFEVEEEIMADLRQSKEYGEYLRKTGWIVEKINGGIQVFIKRIPFLGLSVMKVQRFDGDIDFDLLNNLKRKYWVFYVVLEPIKEMVLKGFKKSGDSYLPSRTLVINLKTSEQALWRELSKDARQRIKKNTGVEIKEIHKEKDLRIFWEMWKKSGKGFVPGFEKIKALKESFGGKCLILGGYLKGELLAGTIVLSADKTAYYYFAWTNQEGKKVGAQYKLVWEGILRSKKNGFEGWDFEGVDDERSPRKSWEGFSAFKRRRVHLLWSYGRHCDDSWGYYEPS